jgi:hypothetical protein
VRRETRSERRTRLDWGGGVLSGAALTAFMPPLEGLLLRRYSESRFL